MAVCVGREGGQEKQEAMVVPGALVVTHRDRMYKISAKTLRGPSSHVSVKCCGHPGPCVQRARRWRGLDFRRGMGP